MQIITQGLCKPWCLCIVNRQKECFNMWRVYFKVFCIARYPKFHPHNRRLFLVHRFYFFFLPEYRSDSSGTIKGKLFPGPQKECVRDRSQTSFHAFSFFALFYVRNFIFLTYHLKKNKPVSQARWRFPQGRALQTGREKKI